MLAHLVTPGSKVKLSDYDTRANAGLDKDQGEALLAPLARQIDDLQELLYAADMHSLLVILQGMDTSGKDGTVRAVFRDVSPLGSHVTAFKVPNEEELAHDFLWRVHRAAPRRGQIAIFNRSHYEDVLVVRVHSLVSESIWRQRYQQINDFERLLAENKTIILKFFLHISKEEQEERLIAREQDVTKAWKLAVGDWKERERWDEYMHAYEDVLKRCSSEHAPWHIVPADRKWYRNIAVAQAIINELKPYKEQWLAKLVSVGAEAKAELAAYRAEQA
ncbi:polyphosphate kinase 2 family protein [Candidatus Gracilibacteria bacterium]|nr:polyphosphate kinase 2 family protein [Candidatus Gracilibacteria bacterium]